MLVVASALVVSIESPAGLGGLCILSHVIYGRQQAACGIVFLVVTPPNGAQVRRLVGEVWSKHAAQHRPHHHHKESDRCKEGGATLRPRLATGARDLPSTCALRCRRLAGGPISAHGLAAV